MRFAFFLKNILWIDDFIGISFSEKFFAHDNHLLTLNFEDWQRFDLNDSVSSEKSSHRAITKQKQNEKK